MNQDEQQDSSLTSGTEDDLAEGPGGPEDLQTRHVVEDSVLSHNWKLVNPSEFPTKDASSPRICPQDSPSILADGHHWRSRQVYYCYYNKPEKTCHVNHTFLIFQANPWQLSWVESQDPWSSKLTHSASVWGWFSRMQSQWVFSRTSGFVSDPLHTPRWPFSCRTGESYFRCTTIL